MIKSLDYWKVLLLLGSNYPHHDAMSSAYPSVYLKYNDILHKWSPLWHDCSQVVVPRSKSHSKCIKFTLRVYSISWFLESFKMTLHNISPPWHCVLIHGQQPSFSFKVRIGYMSRGILQSCPAEEDLAGPG